VRRTAGAAAVSEPSTSAIEAEIRAMAVDENGTEQNIGGTGTGAQSTGTQSLPKPILKDAKLKTTKPPKGTTKGTTKSSPIISHTIVETHNPVVNNPVVPNGAAGGGGLPMAGEKDKIEGYECVLDFDVVAKDAYVKPVKPGKEGEVDADVDVDVMEEDVMEEDVMDVEDDGEGTDYPDDDVKENMRHESDESEEEEEESEEEEDTGLVDEDEAMNHPAPNITPFLQLYNTFQNLTSSDTSSVYTAMVSNLPLPRTANFADDNSKSRYLGLSSLISMHLSSVLKLYDYKADREREVRERINSVILSFDYGIPVSLSKERMREFTEILFCSVMGEEGRGEGREADERRGLVKVCNIWWLVK
jgi:hypothetical protein